MDLTLPLTFLLFLGAAEVALLCTARALFGPRRPGEPISPAYATTLFLGQLAIPFAWMGIVWGWPKLGTTLQADILAVTHFSFVVAVILVQLLVLIGWLLGWQWTRSYWLRIAHLLAISVVALQAATDTLVRQVAEAHLPVEERSRYDCPLTTWEQDLRGGKLSNLDGASAIGRFCNRALYTPVQDQRPMLVRYAIFMAIVIASWYFAPPRWPGESQPSTEGAGAGP